MTRQVLLLSPTVEARVLPAVLPFLGTPISRLAPLPLQSLGHSTGAPGARFCVLGW